MTGCHASGVKIRERHYPNGRIVYQLNVAGSKKSGRKRTQRSFSSLAEAKRAMREEMQKKERVGSLSGLLSAVELAEMMTARERIVAAGGTLSEAVDFWLRHGVRIRETLTVPVLVERFIEAKRDAARSRRYVSQLGVSLGSFARRFPLLSAAEVMTADVEAWLRGGGWAAKTWNNYLGDVSALFEWARRHGFMRSNPAVNVERRRLADVEIHTLTLEECRALLDAAAGGLIAGRLEGMRRKEARRMRQRAALLGYVVLGLFAGVRPAEIERLDWAAADVDAGHVVIAGAKAKTRARRVIDLEPCAVAWLRLIGPDLRTGRICCEGFEDAWRVFRRDLGWAVATGASHVRRGDAASWRGAWPQNAMRHTFASYHFAHWNNEARLQALMGHESPGMLHRHYRALKTSAEAACFWGMLPGSF